MTFPNVLPEPSRRLENGRGSSQHRELFRRSRGPNLRRLRCSASKSETRRRPCARLDDSGDVAAVVVTGGTVLVETERQHARCFFEDRDRYRGERAGAPRARDADSGRSDPRRLDADRRAGRQHFGRGIRDAVGGDREAALDDVAGVALVRPCDDVPGGPVEAPERNRCRRRVLACRDGRRGPRPGRWLGVPVSASVSSLSCWSAADSRSRRRSGRSGQATDVPVAEPMEDQRESSAPWKGLPRRRARSAWPVRFPQ